jgi:hypothetical protein
VHTSGTTGRRKDLATGHLGCDDPTDSAFIPDFLGIAGNTSGRISRTADLRRVTEARENLPPFPSPARTAPVLHDPTYFEHLGDIPMTPQNKVDRRALPAPGDRLGGSGATAHVGREPIPAPQVIPVPDPMAPAQNTSYIPDLLVYLIAPVCAIAVGLVLEQGFDRLALVLDRWGVVETALTVLIASALAGLLCVRYL